MKKLPSLLLGATLLLSAAPFAQAAPAHVTYKDVPATYSFYEEIESMSDLGVITGYPDGTFKPGQSVTRAQAAIMIGRAISEDGEEAPKAATKFKDVSPSSVASGYIKQAADAGIIQGFPDGSYKPEQKVTRGQMAIFLSRAFELTESDKVTFKDVSPSSAAYPYIGKLIYADITAGYPDNTYKPDQAVTRGQFAAFMDRSFDFVIGEAIDDAVDGTWDDVTTNGKFDIDKFKNQLESSDMMSWDEFLQELKDQGMTLDDFIQEMQQEIDAEA
ncbi:S-layer homology domain-containing protein [Bacillus sp. 1P06AnD]|uniref:S-layer homology domain-containing protein n=1 Tax=Bacillus sp. 1P06AnD TaxID=3132208 RepID=UPI0039A16979